MADEHQAGAFVHTALAPPAVQHRFDNGLQSPGVESVRKPPVVRSSIYEMRTYTFLPGVMNHLVQAWGEAISQREQYSPLAAGMYTELGGLNKWCHIWSYASFAERDRIRGEARQAGVWPPQGSWRQSMIKQENKVLIPAAFSPMH